MIGALLSCCLLLGRMSLRLQFINVQGDIPVDGIKVSILGSDTISHTTGVDGKTSLALDNETLLSQMVSLKIEEPDNGWDFISPWNSCLPSSTLSSGLPSVPIYLGRHGSRELLKNPRFLEAAIREATNRPRPQANSSESSRLNSVKLIDQLAKSRGLDPGDLDNAIRSWKTTGMSESQRGLVALYKRQYQTAIRLLKEAVRKEAVRLADDNSSLSQAYYGQGSYQLAMDSINEALRIYPNNPDYLSTLGSCWLALGHLDEADKFLNKAYELDQKLPGEQEVSLAIDKLNIGCLAYAQTDFAKASKFQSEALDTFQQHLGNDDATVAVCETDLADTMIALGDFEKAVSLTDHALSVARKQYNPLDPATAAFIQRCAIAHFRRGEIEKSIALSKSAFEILIKDPGDSSPTTITAIANYAFALNAAGRYQEADPLFVRALRDCRSVFGESHPKTIVCATNLASNYIREDNFGEATKILVPLNSRVALLEQSDKLSAANIVNLQGRLLANEQKYEKAVPCLQKALDLGRIVFGEDNPTVATLETNLADSMIYAGRLKEAELLLQDGLRTRKRHVSANHPELGQSFAELGKLEMAKGRWENARTFIIQGLEIRETKFGKYHPDSVASYIDLAKLSRFCGELAESEKLLSDIVDHEKVNDMRSNRLYARHLLELSKTLEAIGKYSDAEQFCLEAIQIGEKESWNEDLIAFLTQYAHVMKKLGLTEKVKETEDRLRQITDDRTRK